MLVKDLKTKIKTNNIPHFLIFTGEEIRVARIYINKIASTLNLPLIYSENVEEVYKAITKTSFITNNACYVVLEDNDIIGNEKALLAVKEKLKNNILILQYDKLDKRSKFYKQNDICDFEKLDSDILLKYVQRDCNLTFNNCKRLIDLCENNYSRILLEIDKINSYGLEPNTSFQILLDEGTIYQPPFDAIFDFVNAVLRKQLNSSFKLLEISYNSGCNTLSLLSALYINTKQVIQVQTCQSNDVAKNTGLTSWQIKCAKDKCGYYTVDQLLNILKLINEMEQKIKLGLIEESIAISSLLVDII